jgi:hypothetical protein
MAIAYRAPWVRTAGSPCRTAPRPDWCTSRPTKRPFPTRRRPCYAAKPRGMNNGLDKLAGDLPPDPAARLQIAAGLKGYVVAWNPALAKEAWRIDLKGPWNGGVLSTAGNLLFQGNASGEFAAYRADSGERLWSLPTQTGVMAGPMTYEVGGVQYVAVLAGWGGVFPLVAGELSEKSGKQRNVSRLLVYKLGGSASLPAPDQGGERALDPPVETADEDTLNTRPCALRQLLFRLSRRTRSRRRRPARSSRQRAAGQRRLVRRGTRWRVEGRRHGVVRTTCSTIARLPPCAPGSYRSHCADKAAGGADAVTLNPHGSAYNARHE